MARAYGRSAAPHMPSNNAVRKWATQDHEGFGAKYARARAMQAEHYAGEIIEIVDSDPDPVRARNRMDARKWVSSKLAPKKYSDKVEAENRTTVATDDPLT